jgi:hypothetical protein
VNDVIISEVNYLKDTDKGLKSQGDLVITLKSMMNQLITCYATTDQGHSMNLVRGMGGQIQCYFDYIQVKHSPRPQVNGRDFATCLIHLDRSVVALMEMAQRDARGQAEDQLVHILGVVSGLLVTCKGQPRQGYEVDAGNED